MLKIYSFYSNHNFNKNSKINNYNNNNNNNNKLIKFTCILISNYLINNPLSE